MSIAKRMMEEQEARRIWRDCKMCGGDFVAAEDQEELAHLKRHHAVPIYCESCRDIFED